MYPEEQQIFWYSGLYLQPQHLQSIDLHHSNMQALMRRSMQPWNHGIESCELNLVLLQECVVKIENIKLVFESGYFLQYPGNTTVNSYDFRDKWALREVPLKLYLALRRFDPSTTNVSHDFIGRWVSDNETSVMKDVYHDGPECTVSRIAYNLQIMNEEEIKTSSDYEYMPWVQLKFQDNKIILDPDFNPPVIAIMAGTPLRQEIDNIVSELNTAALKFEEYKDSTAFSRSRVEQKNVFQSLVMMALNRTLPQLYHFMRAPQVHPFKIYGLLLQLIGELSVFNEQCSFTGKWCGAQRSTLQYSHEYPLPCFREAHSTILRLLNEIVFDDNDWLTLHKDTQHIFNCELHELPDTQSYSLLLALRSDKLVDWEKLMPECSVFKVSSQRHIHTLIQHALSGVGLVRVKQIPRGLPKRTDTYYFKLDICSDSYNDILQTNQLAFYWAEAPVDLDVRIVIIRE